MTSPNDPLASHLTRFLATLDAGFRRFGQPDGLPSAVRDAVAATPRHRFVHRFRIGSGELQDADATPDALLPLIYSDAVMRHVAANGKPLPSSNSEPSYILYLLSLLDLQPGHRVLEIGSGSGWLAAIMAHLVGHGGRVTGIELIADLAAQSRTDLARQNLGRVEIITGDGAIGHSASAPYDRAIITASTWDLPFALFEQVAEGGLILVPIELRSGDGCDVTLLRRRGNTFVAERAVPGWFVPLRGEQQNRTTAQREAPLEAPASRYALPLATLAPNGPAPVAAQFRAFLGRTEPGFVGFQSEEDWHPGRPLPPFGIADQSDGSLALWRAGQIEQYGPVTAARRLAQAYANWTAQGLPGLAAFHLEIYPSDTAPTPAPDHWQEPRGRTTLLWRLKPTPTPWTTLLEDQPPLPPGEGRGEGKSPEPPLDTKRK